MLGLGSTAIGSAVYTLYSGSASAPTISAFGGDLSTGAAGSVRYKVTGAEPDRVLTSRVQQHVPAQSGIARVKRWHIPGAAL